MKSNVPWSVKGIERDARETAKEAAKREGMTVGEWLNQMIYAAGDPEASGGDVEGLKLRDVVTAIDHLHKRIADSSEEHGANVGELTSKMGDVVERVQRLERNKPGGDRDRVEALKALEKAVTQVAVQFSDAQQTMLARLDASEKSIENLSSQIASDGAGSDDAGVSAAIEDLQTRLSLAEERASGSIEGQGGDAAFIESTSNRLRVLGDEIKRGGDQISALQATIGKLSQQIEAAERRSAEGVQRTAETLAELRNKVAADAHDGVNRNDVAAVVADQTREMVERVEHLHTAMEKMLARLDGADEGAPLAKAREADTAGDETGKSEDHAEAANIDDGVEASAPQHEAESEQEEAQSSALEADGDDIDDDDEDDFFSFTDDIDASIDDEDAASSERDDDFSFELDEEAEKSSEGASILSEVQKVFSGEATTETKAEPHGDDAEPSIDDELDELLAGLDDTPEEEELHAEDFAAETPPEAEAPPVIGDDASGKDHLEPAKQASHEDAADQTSGDKAKRLTRRTLTPKQKAILAARARRKRLAEQAEKDGVSTEDAEEAAAKQQAIKNVFAASVTSDDDFEDDASSDRQAGLFSKIGGKLPFFGDAKREQEKEDAATQEPAFSNDGDQEALETLTKTASARPVTLALGVGIFLALGLLFFLVRDLIFTPRGADTVSPVSQAAEPVETVTAEPTLEAPEPPAIDPKTLYRDAMTGLNAAGNEAETGLAIEKLEQAAMLGHPPAQLQLGELYKTGQGVDQDLEQARVWFRRAANGGNVLAMHRVGVMTARGEGGSANTPEAVNWFEQAANRGLVDSQYNLGAIYHPSGEGEAQPGSIQDAGKAYYWYSLAAQNGDEQAVPLAAGIGAGLSETQRAEINDAITSWESIPSDVEANTLATTG